MLTFLRSASLPHGFGDSWGKSVTFATVLQSGKVTKEGGCNDTTL